MFQRIIDFANLHAMFPGSLALGVAVSGGADSVFLLHALRELAPRWNLTLSVVHIEHGIRGETSVRDAEFVRRLAASFGLPFRLRSVNATAIPGNLEQAARRIRQAFFADLIAAGTIQRIATGHTRNDQAETVLYRILRGTGLTGLSGILPVTNEGMVRPLLEIDRSEIEAWLRERNIPWREDETNQNRTYARNRLRHEILPLLRDAFNPQLDGALANFATLARDEERFWQEEILRRNMSDGVIPLAQIEDAQPALARRLIRHAITRAKGDLRQIDFAHVEKIRAMAEGDRFQIPGLDVTRSHRQIVLAPPSDGYSIPLIPPTTVELPAISTRMTLQVMEKPAGSEPCATVVSELDWQRFHSTEGVPQLELRNWRPGDRYQRVGQSKPEKLKFLFQQYRVPLWERRNWPIITYNGTIVWARRFGADARFAAGPGTNVVLKVGDSGIDRTGGDV
jgi:tRNA(Ile)-lysidine synthase